jgi:hypothetical protein
MIGVYKNEVREAIYTLNVNKIGVNSAETIYDHLFETISVKMFALSLL